MMIFQISFPFRMRLICSIRFVFLGGEEDSATVAPKGNDYQIDGRAKNSNVGIGWSHQKGMQRHRHRNSLCAYTLNAIDRRNVSRWLMIDGDHQHDRGVDSQTKQKMDNEYRFIVFFLILFSVPCRQMEKQIQQLHENQSTEKLYSEQIDKVQNDIRKLENQLDVVNKRCGDVMSENANLRAFIDHLLLER